MIWVACNNDYLWCLFISEIKDQLISVFFISMFKLSSGNQVWKATMFRPLSYSYAKPGKRKMSKRGVDRFLKVKRKVDYERKQREKA